jgi:hypothetical protein
MKKKYFYVALMSMFAVVAISSCNKDDDAGTVGNAGDPSVVKDGKLSGKIEGITDEIDEIRGRFKGYSVYAFKDVPVSNGSFLFTLPTPSNDDLRPLTSLNDNEDYTGKLEISCDANYTTIKFYGFKNNSTPPNYPEIKYQADPGKLSDSPIQVYFYYADKDVVVKGIVSRGVSQIQYNMNLKTGWNMVLGDDTNYSLGYVSTGNIPQNVKWMMHDGK